jgi:hypothetical protein
MKPIKTTNCNSFHEMGETIAAEFLIEEYGLTQNFKVWTQRKTKPNFILMTTEGALGWTLIIRIPEHFWISFI